MKTDRQQVGKRGEEEACIYLKSLGHAIVARNWRNEHREIDIVSLIGQELHVIEVKSRTAPVPADPAFNVNNEKQRKLAAAAKAFIRSPEFLSIPKGGDIEIFFDVVSVVFDGDGMTIDYYPKAYIPIYV